MGRDLEKSVEGGQLDEVWEEATEQTHSLGSFEVDETIYPSIKKTAYKPSLSLDLTKGVGRKWDFFDTDEVNDLMESMKFSIVEGWGERYGLDFEVEAGRFIKTTDNHRHFDRGEYVPHVEVRSLEQNEDGEPLISAEIGYKGPKANPDGLTDWEIPDYIKADVSFNTSNPEYREAYEALDLVIDNVFEDYRDIVGTKWHKDIRSV
jgi:hypothetical protein